MTAPDIALLYADPHLVVADKPSGLAVHRGWARDDDTALFRVRDKIGAHVYPLQRLDRGTSGVLVFARSPEVASIMNRSFEAGDAEKVYLALVRGVPPESGLIDYPLQRSEDGPRVPAQTRFRLLARSTHERCSLVEATPLTGRLHQIRRHLRHIDHPLIGDVKHGRGDINRKYRAEYSLHRLALHAERIAFTHPFEQRRIVVVAPLPDDLRAAFEQLGVWPLPQVSSALPGDIHHL